MKTIIRSILIFLLSASLSHAGILSGIMAGQPAAATGTVVTWDPANKGSNITLSNGNLTAYNALTVQSVFATISKSTGKWQWEITTSGAGSQFVGVASSSASLTTKIGNDVYGWSYSANYGNTYHNNATVYTGWAWTTEVIGVCWDADNGTLKLYKNGTLLGTVFASGVTGTLFPAISAAAGETIIANFGHTTFAYPISGYTAIGY